MLPRMAGLLLITMMLIGCRAASTTQPVESSTTPTVTPFSTATLPPTATLTPTQTLTPTALPTLRPDVTVDFGDEIPIDQRVQIQDGLALGYTCLQMWFGESMPINVYARFSTDDIAKIYSQKMGVPISESWADSVAQTAGRNLFLRTSESWIINSPVQRYVIVIHELFHTQQSAWAGNDLMTTGETTPRSGPIWLIEGSAQYFGERCAAESGLKSWDETLSKYQFAASQSEAQLPSMVTPLDWVQNGSYVTSLLGADILYRQSGWEGFRTYFKAILAGTPWPRAFETAFGITPDDLYAGFDQQNQNALLTSSPLTITLTQVYPAGTTPGAENPNLIGYLFRIDGVDSLGSAYTLTTDRITLPPHSQLVRNTNTEILIAMRTDTPAGMYHLMIDLPDGRKADATFEHNP